MQNRNLVNKHYRWFISLYTGLTLAGCMQITTFVPQGGQPGSEIEIFGSGFSSTTSDNAVRFGTQSANVVEASSMRLLVAVPADVVRAKIKVSRGLFRRATSSTDFIPLPDYLVYATYPSEILGGLKQGYWIMYPPSFGQAGKKFPLVYALHGANFARNPIGAAAGELFQELGITNLGTGNEHSWVFAMDQPGIYFPFIARAAMETDSITSLDSLLHTRLSAVAGEVDLAAVNALVESILFYFPRQTSPPDDTKLADIDEMVIVMPDGDNSWYTDRLGPLAGRNEEGIGTESSFPNSPAESPANRLDLHVTGWYERYLMQELIEKVEQEIGIDKLVAHDKRRFIMGISMGGYGSLKLALKNPDKFVAAASLSASGSIDASNLGIKNKFLPSIIDVFGSAPLAFFASDSQIAAQIHLDADYISANNPMEIIQSLEGSDLHFFLEIGENDIAELFGGAVTGVENFISTLQGKGIAVEGGVIPPAAAGEPDNGNADHVGKFWRTRFGSVLKFFSDIIAVE